MAVPSATVKFDLSGSMESDRSSGLRHVDIAPPAPDVSDGSMDGHSAPVEPSAILKRDDSLAPGPVLAQIGSDERALEELYDPFQKPGEQPVEIEEYDPWESFNVRMFNFNYKLDKYVVKHVAEFYDKVMPDEIELGLSRGFRNIAFIPRFLNSLLQGKFKRAGIEVSRFVINSALGIGGLLDFAKEALFLDAPPPEDTGQTLGLYGVKPGPYLVLPLLPQPFTLRDGVGYVVDIALNPMVYFLPFTTLFPMNVGYQLNERSINLESFQGVEEATVDLYGAVRNAYLQRRAQAIKE
jgi:phospholipid-binding lipoprotein MlaA